MRVLVNEYVSMCVNRCVGACMQAQVHAWWARVRVWWARVVCVFFPGGLLLTDIVAEGGRVKFAK